MWGEVERIRRRWGENEFILDKERGEDFYGECGRSAWVAFSRDVAGNWWVSGRVAWEDNSVQDGESWHGKETK